MPALSAPSARDADSGRPRPAPPGFRFALAVLTILAAVGLAPGVAHAQPEATGYRPGEIIVKYRETAPAAAVLAARARITGTVRTRFASTGAECLVLDGADVEEAIAALAGDPGVEYVEPNYLWQVVAIPDDPRFTELWGLHNTGSPSGVAGADIDAAAAWDVATGSREIVVAVIDTGVDTTHPDLAANIWTNPGEIAGNGLDDDGNGLVDDVHGYDFYANDGDPGDPHGHGTHCAGTIGAVGNNGIGVVGVNWNVRIMALRFLGPWGSGTSENAIRCVEYAAAMGAHITSNSWGSYYDSEALRDAIAAAGRQGVLFVAAAGNSRSDNDVVAHYPSSYNLDNIVAVAASDRNDALSDFSNWGRVSVDIAAPGTDILSTFPGGGYAVMSGTSMAAPHVAGAAALVWSEVPAAEYAAVRSLLLAAAEPVPAFADRVASGGRLNIRRALLAADDVPPAPVTDLQITEVASNWVRLAWTATGDDGVAGTAHRYEIRYSPEPLLPENFAEAALFGAPPPPRPAGQAESVTLDGLEPGFTYHVAMICRDELGNPSALSNAVIAITLGPPRLEVPVTGFSASLVSGAVSRQTLTIANPSAGVLDFTLLDLVEDAPADPTAMGAGGPDAFGYVWHDSDDADGPVFSWRDIRPYGDRVVIGDGAVAGPVYLDFPFTYYGEVYDRVWIGADGFLAFAPPAAVGANGPLPSTTAPLNLIAPFWYSPLVAGGGGAFSLASDEGFVVQWQDLTVGDDPGSYTFQVVLSPSGTMTFRYLDLGPAAVAGTVGIQDATGQRGLRITRYGSYVRPGLAVEIRGERRWAQVVPDRGSVPPGGRVELGLTFNALALCDWHRTGSITLLSNDPDNPLATIAVAMDVQGEPDVRAVPGLVAATGLRPGIEYRLPLRIVNPGCGPLQVAGVTCDLPQVSLGVAPFTLDPGTYRDLELSVRADAPGAAAGQVLVDSDDPDEPLLAIPVELAFEPAPVIEPATLDLPILAGTGAVGTATVDLRNAGGSDLHWTAYVITTPSATAAAPPLEYTTEAAPAASGQADEGSSPPRAPFAKRIARAPYVYAGFERVLVLADGPGYAGRPLYARALERLGIGHTLTTSWPVFAAELRDGSGWDLVVIDSDGGGPAVAVLHALRRHVAGGGRLILADRAAGAYADHPLFDLLDARPGGDPAGSSDLHCPGQAGVGARTLAPDAGRGDDGARWLVPAPGATVLVTAGEGGRPVSVRNRAGTTVCNGFRAADYPDGAGIVDLLAEQVLALAPDAAWLTIDPTGGTIPPSGTGGLGLHYDAGGLCGGAYPATIRIASNDPLRPSLDLQVILAVSGEPILAVPEPRIGFGDVVLGASVTGSAVVHNEGCDLLVIDRIVSASVEFVPVRTSLFVGPGESADVVVRFTPTAEGAAAGELTLYHNDVLQMPVAIALTAVAVPPPVIAVAAEDLEVTLGSRQSTSRTVDVTNDGDSELRVELAVVADGQSPEPDRSASFTVIGRPFAGGDLDSLCANGAAQVPPDVVESCYLAAAASSASPRLLVLEGGTDVPGYYRQAVAALGYDHTVVTTAGLLAERLGDAEPWDLVVVNSGATVLDEALLGMLVAHVDAGGALVYADWRIYQYPGHPLLSLLGIWFEHTISIPIGFGPLAPGHPLFSRPNAVPDLRPSHDQYYRDGQLVGVLDGAEQVASFAEHPLSGAVVVGPTRRTIFNGFQAINFQHDDDLDGLPDMLELLENEISYLFSGVGRVDVSPRSMVLAPAQSAAAVVSYDAAMACASTWTGKLSLASNDAVRPLVELPARLTVIAAPSATAFPDTLVVPPTVAGATGSALFTVRNEGCEDLHVTGIGSSDPAFAVEQLTEPVPPGGQAVVAVAFTPPAVGRYEAVLTIASDDPGRPLIGIVASGFCPAPPSIALAPSRLDLTAEPGGVVAGTLRISNDGDGVLEFALVADGSPDLVDVADAAAASLESVLIYEGGTLPHSLYEEAAVSLGLTPLVTRSISELELQLASGTGWDLVIVNNYGAPLTSAATIALIGHRRAGGRMLLADAFVYANRTSALYTEMGVSFVHTIAVPIDFRADIPAHPCFRHPNQVGALRATDDQLYRDGQLVDVIGGAGKLAHFDGYPDQAAIVQTADGHSFFNAFQAINYLADDDRDGVRDIVELLANEIGIIAYGDYWLRCVPDRGTVGARETREVTVSAVAPYECSRVLAAGISVLSNDPERPELEFAATITAADAQHLAVGPPALPFGRTFVGSTTALSLRLHNLGCSDLTIDGIVCSSPEVSVDPQAATIAPQDSLIVAVTYAPAGPGELAAELVVASDDPERPTVAVPLSAVAVLPPVARVAPDSLTADLPPNQAVTLGVTIGNDGGWALAWTATVRSPGAGEDDEAPAWIRPLTTGGSVPGGEELVLGLAVTSQGLCGIDNRAELVIATDDPSGPEFVVPVHLRVEAVVDLVLEAASVELGDVFVGVPRTEPFALRNDGCLPLRIIAVRTSHPALTVDTDGFLLQAFGRRQFAVTCVAELAGRVVGSVLLDTDDEGIGTITIPVEGVAALAPAAAITPAAVYVAGIAVQPGVPVVRTLDLTNAGAGDLLWDSTIDLGDDPRLGTWLALSPRAGVVAAGNSSHPMVYLYLPAWENLEANGSIHLTCNDPLVPALDVPVAVRIGVVSAPDRTLQAGWSLVALPLRPEPGADTVQQTLLRGLDGGLSVFRDDGPGGCRQLGLQDTVAPGEGFWAYAAAPFALAMRGATPMAEMGVPLRAGWNLIGYPLPDSRTLVALTVEYGGLRFTLAEAVDRNLVGPVLLDWDGTRGTYAAAGDLLPWHGYWCAAYGEDVSLLFDPAPPQVPPAPAALLTGGDSWSLHIALVGQDDGIVVGMRPDGHDGFDARWDLPAPPPPPQADATARLVMDRPSWKVPGFTAFRADLRASGPGPCAWDVRMAGPPGEYRLRWDPAGLPQGRDLQLVRTATGEVLVAALAGADGCAVALTDGDLLLRIQSPDFAPDPASPEEGLRLRNVPNPFNLSTDVRFNLPRTGHVEVRVFDLRGALVRRLEAGVLPPGPLEITWQGCDGQDVPVSSGTYFYGVFLDGSQLGPIGKMTLLK